jgi:hypothetical protein
LNHFNQLLLYLFLPDDISEQHNCGDVTINAENKKAVIDSFFLEKYLRNLQFCLPLFLLSSVRFFFARTEERRKGE